MSYHFYAPEKAGVVRPHGRTDEKLSSTNWVYEYYEYHNDGDTLIIVTFNRDGIGAVHWVNPKQTPIAASCIAGTVYRALTKHLVPLQRNKHLGT